METLNKNRKSFRSAVTRGARGLDTLLAADPVDLDGLQVAWEVYQQRFEELKVVDEQIYSALLEDDESEEVLAADLQDVEVYLRRFFSLKIKCNKLLNGEDAASVVSTQMSNASASQVGKRKFKLPTIEFKKYDGTIKDWLAFWSQFKKIDEDETIDESDKIAYLVQATVEGSKARKLVESFPAMAGNYDKIVDSLKARFGRDDLQIEVYIRELLQLILINATSRGKVDISVLYDQLETQLRALDTLGVTSAKCSAMLYPLIESCLPEDMLRAWQRATNVAAVANDDKEDACPVEQRLTKLMQFLRTEVENEQRISLASEGFGIRSVSTNNDNRLEKPKKSSYTKQSASVATAAGLINAECNKCLFCGSLHDSVDCFKAQKYSLEQKRRILADKKACYRCLKPGHISKKCLSRLKCLLCGKPHVILMCPELPAHKQSIDTQTGQSQSSTAPATVETLANRTYNPVVLQTLKIDICTGEGLRSVRALMDSGSSRSYLLKSATKLLNYGPKRKEKLVHGLFGGSSEEVTHNCYDLKLVKGQKDWVIEVLDQKLICHDIPCVDRSKWENELGRLNVIIEEDSTGPIELLLGADVIGHFYTGKKEVLSCGLVAVDTVFGWTLMGRRHESSAYDNMVLSCLTRDMSITNLWELEVLGIKDPTETKTRAEKAQDAQTFFRETLTVNDEGRYEACLPWLANHPPLPTNFGVAKNRLSSTLQKVKTNELYQAYDQVFKEWKSEGIIEVVQNDDNTKGHYLPHRPIVKEHSTTKIRPVFDASAREKNNPSLNQCLEKGPNLIEQIPSVLLRFRELRIGVVSDIRKAFLQIGICESDRDFLKFLWIDPGGNEIVFRHRRVVFGISSSPFLLGATIEFHLSKSMERCDSNGSYSKKTVSKLAQSFYVDNCVTSVASDDQLREFIQDATTVMREGNFDLRGWEYSCNSSTEAEIVPVLGLIWDIRSDTLMVNVESLKRAVESEEEITKRVILSITQRLFDPIGFTCPATLRPKLLLRELWKKKLPWDQRVSEDDERVFREWCNEWLAFRGMKIHRWIGLEWEDTESWSLHLFCDASKNAYSAVIFLRTIQDGEVVVRLLAAKSRVAPMKEMTIPRLELLAATIGARLYASVVDGLQRKGTSYFWSDSSTVVSWIRRQEEWSTFVSNRVKEIRQITPSEQWKHVPGKCNPADLPSRGCSPSHLLETRWWEGPKWLRLSPECWPQVAIVCDEEEITQERKRKLVENMLSQTGEMDWHLDHFSKHSKTVRMIGWTFRFLHNSKNPQEKRAGELSVSEFEAAEGFVLRRVQAESFRDEKDRRLAGLNSFKDQSGLIRVKSQVSNRKDSKNFRFPIVLPAKHDVVDSIIYQAHVNSCHIGTQGLLCLLRENYWIFGGRRTVKKIVSKCVLCRKVNGKPFVVETPPLLADRVREAKVFEIVGVDLAGPLFLRNGKKSWICLFTCAVYRAVHMELVSSLSTETFLQALRRFIARRGRPVTIYSDNGTNFVGADNAFRQLNWIEVQKFATVRRIVWKFNPPSAPWWGGFWERLIGIVKQMLKKVLSRASLMFEELYTVICDCEATVNSRPLTYITSDPKELAALTPAMFLHEQTEYGVPDCDAIDSDSLNRKVKYLQRLRDDLRNRFRNEYLGQLKVVSRGQASRSVTVGEMVLVGNDNDKRVSWPLARVIELLPGKDNRVRLARVETSRGQLLRPVQRLYPLETACTSNVADSPSVHSIPEVNKEVETSADVAKEGASAQPTTKKQSVSVSAGVKDDQVIKSRVPEPKIVVTRSGRLLRKPARYVDF